MTFKSSDIDLARKGKCGGDCTTCALSGRHGGQMMRLEQADAALNVGQRLIIGLNLGTLAALPRWSSGPVGDAAAIAIAIRDAGYAAVQGSDDPAYAAAGLQTFGSGSVRRAQDALPLLRRQQALGHAATTLHVGSGMESDSAAMSLIEAVVSASELTGHPAYIETHRATITQDIWRTLRWVTHFPEMRFNADLSHWYTGLEMPYGDFTGKLEALAPVFARTRFIHGRVGNAGSMQVPIGLGGRDQPHLSHFTEMWRRCFTGFFASARADENLVFVPELLPSTTAGPNGPVYMEYAQLHRGASGTFEEASDRWQQAIFLAEIARSTFHKVIEEIASTGPKSSPQRGSAIQE